ncbi:MAG: hypothetical protein ACLR5S_09115 [Ruminococcus sp.]
MVRRALRNVNVISREGQKRVLSYVSQEETAELLTRGVLHDIPIVTAVRKADGVCDILRYSYSTDMADSLCRTMTPICGAVTLLIAVGMTLIRMGTAFGMPWISFFCSMLALLQVACCGTASALAVNLPLERESKRRRHPTVRCWAIRAWTTFSTPTPCWWRRTTCSPRDRCRSPA